MAVGGGEGSPTYRPGLCHSVRADSYGDATPYSLTCTSKKIRVFVNMEDSDWSVLNVVSDSANRIFIKGIIQIFLL